MPQYLAGGAFGLGQRGFGDLGAMPVNVPSQKDVQPPEYYDFSSDTPSDQVDPRFLAGAVPVDPLSNDDLLNRGKAIRDALNAAAGEQSDLSAAADAISAEADRIRRDQINRVASDLGNANQSFTLDTVTTLNSNINYIGAGLGILAITAGGLLTLSGGGSPIGGPLLAAGLVITGASLGGVGDAMAGSGGPQAFSAGGYVYDSDGNPVAGQTVTINVNGVYYQGVSGDNGQYFIFGGGATPSLVDANGNPLAGANGGVWLQGANIINGVSGNIGGPGDFSNPFDFTGDTPSSQVPDNLVAIGPALDPGYPTGPPYGPPDDQPPNGIKDNNTDPAGEFILPDWRNYPIDWWLQGLPPPPDWTGAGDEVPADPDYDYLNPGTGGDIGGPGDYYPPDGLDTSGGDF